jgi:hypothetical protein
MSALAIPAAVGLPRSFWRSFSADGAEIARQFAARPNWRSFSAHPAVTERQNGEADGR